MSISEPGTIDIRDQIGNLLQKTNTFVSFGRGRITRLPATLRSFLVFHKNIHRNLEMAAKTALTGVERIFNVASSTAERVGLIKFASPK